MLIQATRTISTWTLRALFYAALFGVVVIAHLGISGILRAQGWGSNVSLLVAGTWVTSAHSIVLCPTRRGQSWGRLGCCVT